MSSSVEKIKERLSIADVVSSYVKLEKSGASYKGRCPFHNEKTPSLFISPDRGTYYCFGCGAKGDMFTFVEEFEGLEFKQALVNLAARAGVELVPEKIGERDEKEKLFHAVEQATVFFEGELQKNKAALEYLAGRGLTKETIAEWRIGFAPLDWHSLQNHLAGKKVMDADMLATGLIKRNDSPEAKQKFYDVFRGRIMFPIFDHTGRSVAFSGRILVDDKKSPKYLNSPATVLFNKSEVLYGFDRAKTTIRKLNYSILVEGQMDLIMSHQAGLTNTVASSGTALSETHLRRLQRLSPRIMFAFDSDSAGFAATKRSAELALTIGMEVKVAVLPPGDDPASLVAKNPNHWKHALKVGKHVIDFHLDNILARKLDPRVLSREIKSEVLPSVLDVESKTEQAHFIKTIAEKADLKEEALWDDLKALAKIKKTGATAASPSGGGVIMLASRKQAIERRIVGAILWQEGKKDQVVTSAAIRKRFAEIVGEEEERVLERDVGIEKEKLIFEAEQYYEHSSRFNEEIEELFINMEEEVLKGELIKKMSELHKAELGKDGEMAKKLLTEYVEVTNKLSALKKKHI